MSGYRAYIETEKYGRVVVALCEACTPEDADIQGHISDDRHYGEEGVEQATCYGCDKSLGP